MIAVICSLISATIIVAVIRGSRTSAKNESALRQMQACDDRESRRLHYRAQRQHQRDQESEAFRVLNVELSKLLFEHELSLENAIRKLCAAHVAHFGYRRQVEAERDALVRLLSKAFDEIRVQ